MTTPTSRPTPDIARAEAAIAETAASFPEVTEDAPWGHRAFKVRGKTFLFLVADADGLSISVKLPHSGDLALAFEFAEPTGYGLGKSGWVSARFAPGAPVPVPLVREWLEESYRAIAPKKLGAMLAPEGARSASAAKAAKKAAAKKAAPAKASARAAPAKASARPASAKASARAASTKASAATNASAAKVPPRKRASPKRTSR